MGTLRDTSPGFQPHQISSSDSDHVIRVSFFLIDVRKAGAGQCIGSVFAELLMRLNERVDLLWDPSYRPSPIPASQMDPHPSLGSNALCI